MESVHTLEETEASATWVQPRVMRVRSKGQLTIPQGLTEVFHLQEGAIVVLEPTAEGILIRPQKLVDASPSDDRNYLVLEPDE